MGKLTSPSTIKYIMAKYDFKFSIGLGQNFLINEQVVQSIVNGAEISEEDYILEVGPGIGVMTYEMASRAKQVVAVEIDSFLLPVLEETLASFDNVKVINNDILKIDLESIISEEFNNHPPKVVANLPYYITTPIVMKLLEDELPISDIVVMVQKEVADRMMAGPNTKAYGALSVAVQYYSDPEIITVVPKSSFMPQPNVSSSVIRLKIRPSSVDLISKDIFFKTVKDAFSKRRKTLLNALSSGIMQISKDNLKTIFDETGIDPGRRGETLSIEEFALLSNAIAKRSR
ncbi:MAG: 16S rRNA (adenine(1518)-N(6)/adenine(1519)-N(6))-dimethyltransferase RsmA [Clostridia bacterium]|nr:16S rRNA (adenine(1518)-N(6)/adenine(1519)-N(6))-dimethyltransferase RsmA [Clostridia bacterium]